MKTIKALIKTQLFKFMIVGAICAVIEYLSFYILIFWLDINYLIANVMSMVISITINYFLSRAFVFEKSKFSAPQEFLAFMFFSGIGILLNQMIVYLMVEIIHIDVKITKAVAIGAVATFNYITKKHIVFKK